MRKYGVKLLNANSQDKLQETIDFFIFSESVTGFKVHNVSISSSQVGYTKEQLIAAVTFSHKEQKPHF